MQKTYIIVGALLLIMIISFSINNNKKNTEPKSNNSEIINQEEEKNIEEIHPQDSTFYTIDTNKSELIWHATQNTIKNEHYGNVNISEGVIIYSEGNFVAGDFVVDMTSIKDRGDNEFLEKHLKSEDFFDVEKHSTAILKLIEVNKIDQEDTYKIKANLTIKKITHPIEFDAKVIFNNENLEAEAEFAIDRTKWDIRYGSGKFFEDIGDKIIDDQIEFTIKITAQV